MIALIEHDPNTFFSLFSHHLKKIWRLRRQNLPNPAFFKTYLIFSSCADLRRRGTRTKKLVSCGLIRKWRPILTPTNCRFYFSWYRVPRNRVAGSKETVLTDSQTKIGTWISSTPRGTRIPVKTVGARIARDRRLDDFLSDEKRSRKMKSSLPPHIP